MPIPQDTKISDISRHLTKVQILCLMAADSSKGCLYPGTPEWLIQECQDLGLVTPGDRIGTWRLSQDGWDARAALLEE